jgi:glycosyltransferase involved in cell wall biosynthesis
VTSVSALILTYNRLPLLQRSLHSAQVQTFDDLEIVVLDNGSTDGTARWLASIDDPRLQVERLPTNINPTRARNHAIDRSSGEWLAFLDDDDLWAPDKVAAQIASAARAGTDWSYTGCVYIDGDGSVTGGTPPPPPPEVAQSLPARYSVPGGLSSLAWRRRAIASSHLDEDLTYTDDWDLALRLTMAGEPACASRPLVAFRQHGGSWSRASERRRDEYRIIEERYAPAFDHHRVERYRHSRFVGGEALRAGARWEAAGHFLDAALHGDLAAVPRLMATALPAGAQQRLRDRFLSDHEWIADGRRWVDELYANTIGPRAALHAGAR